VPKGKEIKVLTHRPKYIETAIVPKLSEGMSSTAEAEQIESPKVPAAGPVKTPKHGAEAKEEVAKEPDLGKAIALPEILSPPGEAELPKVAKAPAKTPKRRRMARVLDAVMETTRALTPAPAKRLPKLLRLVLKPKLGPQCSRRQSLLQLSRELNKNLQILAWLWRRRMHPKKLNLLFPKHHPKILTLLFDMLQGKSYLKKKSWKPDTTPEN
jgi:hypothetical protein